MISNVYVCVTQYFDLFVGCEATAQLMYKGTAMLGCSSYKDAQNAACNCFSKTKKSEKNRKKDEF